MNPYPDGPGKCPVGKERRGASRLGRRCDRSARDIEKLATYDALLLDIDSNLSGSQLVAQPRERDLRLAGAAVRIPGTNLPGATSVTFKRYGGEVHGGMGLADLGHRPGRCHGWVRSGGNA